MKIYYCIALILYAIIIVHVKIELDKYGSSMNFNSRSSQWKYPQPMNQPKIVDLWVVHFRSNDRLLWPKTVHIAAKDRIISPLTAVFDAN